MAALVHCQLYQALSYTNMRFGIGMGYCGLDGNYTLCNGDVDFCEKPKTLIQRVSDRIKREASPKTTEEAGLH